LLLLKRYCFKKVLLNLSRIYKVKLPFAAVTTAITYQTRLEFPGKLRFRGNRLNFSKNNYSEMSLQQRGIPTILSHLCGEICAKFVKIYRATPELHVDCQGIFGIIEPFCGSVTFLPATILACHQAYVRSRLYRSSGIALPPQAASIAEDQRCQSLIPLRPLQ
jgi:hypothetical protein